MVDDSDPEIMQGNLAEIVDAICGVATRFSERIKTGDVKLDEFSFHDSMAAHRNKIDELDAVSLEVFNQAIESLGFVRV